MNPEHIGQLLQELVRIPSVNPHGDPGTDKTGELQMAGFLADYFRKLSRTEQPPGDKPGDEKPSGNQ